jgi:hypothetical protein
MELLKARFTSDESLRLFQQTYIENAPPLMYEDSQRFLDMLEERGLPSVVWTYGKEPLWQEMKVRASGYTGPYEVMGDKAKGGRIAAARQENGGYVYLLNGHRYEAASVCLIDDKPESFNDLPSDCKGFLIQRARELLPSQRGSLPGEEMRVERISSLRQLGATDRRQLILISG